MEGESQALKDELKAQIESMAKAETEIESAKADRDQLKKDLEEEEEERKKILKKVKKTELR